MKKYVFISLLALVAMVFTGCYTNDPLHKKTVDLVVKSRDWRWDSSGQRFFCEFEVPELTSKVYNYGEVSLNREYNSGKENMYQVSLPETTFMTEEVDDGNGSTSIVYYTQLVDYIYGPEFVAVYYTVNDYYYSDDFLPEAMVFRLQMTY